MIWSNITQYWKQQCNEDGKPQTRLLKTHKRGPWSYCLQGCCPFSPRRRELSDWGRDKMAAIFQMTFSNGFSLMKMYEFWLIFHWNMFLRIKLSALVQMLACTEQVARHYLNQLWFILLMHMCITQPQWVNEIISATKCYLKSLIDWETLWNVSNFG